MAETAIDRINAVLQAAYESEDEKRKAVAAARAAEFSTEIGPRDIQRGRFTLSVQRASISGGRVEIFARVYRDGVQLGFGPDGTVDVERFVIHNPPLLVPDDVGDIVRQYTDLVTQEVIERRFRVDVREALLTAIAGMVQRAAKNGRNIIPGKEGRSVTVFYADATDGFITSSNATYSTARSGSGQTADDTNTVFSAGQVLNAGTYFCYEGFIQFDTSSIADAATINSALLSLNVSADASTTDFTIEARLKDWGTGLTTADWVAGASLGSQTLLASVSTSGISTDVYLDLTSDAAFVSNINKTGATRLMLCSSRHRGNNTPAGFEFAVFYSADNVGTSQDPMLTVDATSFAMPVFIHHYRQQGIM